MGKFLLWGLAWAGIFMLGTARAEPLVAPYLMKGDLAGGEKALAQQLRENPGNDQARFELGTLQFLQAIEHWGQGMYRYGAYGARSRVAQQAPLIRFPVPENPAPEAISYQDFRRLLGALVDELGQAERTLAQVDDNRVKLPLQFALLRLDINGDGQGSEHEALWRMFARLNRGSNLNETTAQQAEKFEIAFDYGDVLWLRGYCHLLSALGDMLLAYDQRDLFEVVAPAVFAKTQAAAGQGALLHEGLKRDPWAGDIADLIAMIHLARFPLVESKRMQSALAHLEEVIRLSRLTWKAIEAETDDDREWLPNARQANVVLGVRVTDDLIKGWHDFLGEAERVLQGKTLVPHWRFESKYGINLRRVFTEPREFDLVLWAHGAAALPYREEGEVADWETWQRINRMFRGEFIGFAIWFN